MSDSKKDILRKDWESLKEFSQLHHLEEYKTSSNFNLKFLPNFLIRSSHQCFVKGKNIRSKIYAGMLYFIYRIEYTPKCKIEGGLVMPHPNSIIFGASDIGENCVIFNEVTIGAKYPDPLFLKENRPSIGNNVLVNAGAIIANSVADILIC